MPPACDILVGPGETFTTIQAGVNAASPGQTVCVKPGVYNETVTINKTIQLLGAQAGSDARTRPGNPADESIVTGGGIQVQADNVVIDGFTIQQVGPAPLGTGIFLSQSFSGYRVANNIIQDNIFGMGLNSNGTNQTVVERNLFRNNNQSGAASGNGIFSNFGVQNALIVNNLFTGHTSAAMVFNGDATHSNVTISGNRLVTDNSIALFRSSNFVIQNNISTDSQGSTIFIGGGVNGVLIQNNLLLNGATNGIRVTRFSEEDTPNQNVEAHFNCIQGNDIAGLQIDANSYVGDPLDATNNWWGHPSGPFNPVLNPTGQGDAVIVNPPDQTANTVDFIPWLTTDEPCRLLPNNAMPECICVPKVYDWVLVSEDIGNFTFTVPAGAGCPTTTPVTVTCATSLSPNTPLCTGESNATLEIVSIRPANIDGANVKVVTLNVIFDIDITISGGGATCTLTGQTVSFKEQLVLCFPDTFDESNLRSRILTLVCDLVDFTPPVGTTDGSITLELVICKEVQVQAEVKLEVEAKFCQPRPPIAPPPFALCPPINFPQQCDIFPIANCSCQAFISADCDGPVTTTGAICTAVGTVNGVAYNATTQPAFTQSIVASICSNCSPQNTNITYVYTDTDATDPNQSFTFRAQGANTVTCTPNAAGVITLIVTTGQGTITLANGTVINNVNYTLTLNTGVAPNAWTLLLTDVTTTTLITANGLIGPDDTLTITDCVTLG